jgi:hypothetical protein
VGPPSIVLSFDGGKTLVQSRTPRTDNTEVYGLVSLGKPYTLAALVGASMPYDPRELFVSVDGGCHWTRRGTTWAYRIAEGRDGVAYAWDARAIFAITADTVRRLTAPPGTLVHVEADVADSRHLRVLGEAGVFDSADGGSSWRKVGVGVHVGNGLPSAFPTVAFAEKDLDHILFGGFYDPIRYTRDGGRTWATSVGAERAGDLRLSPDGRVAWSVWSSVFRSTDGGATFAEVANVVQGHADVALFGAQPDPHALVYAVAKDSPRSRFVVRFDVRSFQWTTQLLPINPGKDTRPYEDAGSEVVSAGTFVPGEPLALCLGIRRIGPWRDLE